MRTSALTSLALGFVLAGCAGAPPSGKTQPEGMEETGGSTGTGGKPAPSTGGSTGTGGMTGTGGSTGTGGMTSTGGSGGSAPDAGPTTSPDAAPVVSEPNAPCPRCVRIFTGTNFDGWEAGGGSWKIVEGAMLGMGGTSRAAYTKKDYGNVRLIVTSKLDPANGDHLGILFWGNRPMDPNKPQIDNAGWVQWMPPFGGMWSYHPPMHHGLTAMKLAPSPSPSGTWHTSELLLNLDKGTLRVAVNGIETTRYTHQWPTEREDPTKRIIRGPLAMMKHGRGGSHYKDIWVEDEPTEDKLYTLKK